jgi:hypothetical protein
VSDTDTDTGWRSALDAYDARLRAQRAALEGTDPAVDPFVAPDGLGPLPPALAGRARELLEESHALETELATRAAAAQESTAMTSRPNVTPSFLDTRV